MPPHSTFVLQRSKGAQIATQSTMHRGQRDVVATLAKSGANDLDIYIGGYCLYIFLWRFCIYYGTCKLKYMRMPTVCFSATCRCMHAERHDVQNLWLWLHLTACSLRSALPQRPQTPESTTAIAMWLREIHHDIRVAHNYCVDNAKNKESKDFTINE